MLNPLGSQKLNLDTIKTTNPINEENKWVSSTISKDIKTDTQNTKFFNPSNNIKEDVIKKKNIESFNSKNKDEFDGFEIVSGINLNKGKPLGYTLENPEKKASEWKNQKIEENNWKLLETEENNPEKINIRPLSADKSPEKSISAWHSRKRKKFSNKKWKKLSNPFFLISNKPAAKHNKSHNRRANSASFRKFNIFTVVEAGFWSI